MSKRQGKMKGRNFRRRRVNFRDVRSRFLIVCEGEQTEPNYFNRFRVPMNLVVVGLGQNTSSLVSETIKLANRERFEFDQVWCVFDRDIFPAKNFCDAIDMAKANGVKVAYSNEAFELWFVLHFQYLDTAQSRDSLVHMLCDLLGKKYQKNSTDIYDELEFRQKDAIRNATRLLDSYHHLNPEKANPSTTVHLLVQELNRFAP